MISNTKAAAVVSPGVAKVSKEPDFLGPDELPMLPEYLVNQNPTDADKYHMQMKEWWESVHENLGRMQEMVVSYQVAEAKEKGDVDLTAASKLLSQQSLDLVESLDATLQEVINAIAQNINEHEADTNNPHSVTPQQLNLHAVATSGDYQDLTNKPEYSYDDTTKTLTITNT